MVSKLYCRLLNVGFNNYVKALSGIQAFGIAWKLYFHGLCMLDVYFPAPRPCFTTCQSARLSSSVLCSCCMAYLCISVSLCPWKCCMDAIQQNHVFVPAECPCPCPCCGVFFLSWHQNPYLSFKWFFLSSYLAKKFRPPHNSGCSIK